MGGWERGEHRRKKVPPNAGQGTPKTPCSISSGGPRPVCTILESLNRDIIEKAVQSERSCSSIRSGYRVHPECNHKRDKPCRRGRSAVRAFKFGNLQGPSPHAACAGAAVQAPPRAVRERALPSLLRKAAFVLVGDVNRWKPRRYFPPLPASRKGRFPHFCRAPLPPGPYGGVKPLGSWNCPQYSFS